MAVHRANLNNQPELPELRHRRMPQALTTIMQSGSMRAGGRDSRSDMKDGTGSPVAMPACTAPLRVKWLHLAAALIGIAATMVPGVGIADDVYLRAGIGFDRPAETRFMDKDCSSVSPAALYGCGTGVNAGVNSGHGAGVKRGHLLMPDTVLPVVPAIHRRDPRCFVSRLRYAKRSSVGGACGPTGSTMGWVVRFLGVSAVFGSG